MRPQFSASDKLSFSQNFNILCNKWMCMILQRKTSKEQRMDCYNSNGDKSRIKERKKDFKGRLNF